MNGRCQRRYYEACGCQRLAGIGSVHNPRNRWYSNIGMHHSVGFDELILLRSLCEPEGEGIRSTQVIPVSNIRAHH